MAQAGQRLPGNDQVLSSEGGGEKEWQFLPKKPSMGLKQVE
jgi:hypothetical protein